MRLMKQAFDMNAPADRLSTVRAVLLLLQFLSPVTEFSLLDVGVKACSKKKLLKFVYVPQRKKDYQIKSPNNICHADSAPYCPARQGEEETTQVETGNKNFRLSSRII